MASPSHPMFAISSDDLPTHMSLHDMQETNERRFARKHINTYLDKEIRENLESEGKVYQGVALLNIWRNRSYFPSKDARLVQLANFDIEQLVRDIFIGIAYYRHPELFVSVTAQLAFKLGFDDHADSIKTVAEMVAVLSETDAFDIIKPSKYASLMVVNRLTFSEQLHEAMSRSMFIPPMVCEPLEIRNNFESPYLTFNECQILRASNAHSEDICLDVINTQNKVPLKLALDFLSTEEEQPTYELDTLDKIQDWKIFKQHSYGIYHLIAKQGNRFWITNKVDKRLRLYAYGYHINTQGTPFKKAVVELYNEEIVEGVPT